MQNNLPEPEYFTIEILSRKWGCPESEVLHYGCTGQLRMCVLSEGWYLLGGYYDEVEEGHFINVPDKQYYSYNEFLELEDRTVREIMKDGEKKNPDFFDGIHRFLYLDPNKYDLEEPREYTYPPIIIRPKDLMIRKSDKEAFEARINCSQTDTMTGYVSPYIQLMLSAIKEKGISNEDQGKAEDLQKWFLSQTVVGHKVTVNEAKLMATFIRLPSSKKGGNKKLKKG